MPFLTEFDTLGRHDNVAEAYSTIDINAYEVWEVEAHVTTFNAVDRFALTFAWQINSHGSGPNDFEPIKTTFTFNNNTDYPYGAHISAIVRPNDNKKLVLICLNNSSSYNILGNDANTNLGGYNLDWQVKGNLTYFYGHKLS